MGAAIWWTPPGAAAAEKISLSRPLADLQVLPERAQVVTEAWSGAESVSATRARSRIRVTYGPFTSNSERRELEALLNHLDRGGTCQLAEDDTEAYAAFVSSLETVGHQNSGTTMHPTPWAHSGAVPGAGDAIVLTGPSPRYRQEFKAVGTWGSATRLITWTPATAFDWSGQAWCLVRHEGFWPALKRAPDDRGRQALKHAHRRHYTLELDLVEDMDLLDLIAETPDQPLLIDSESGNPSEQDIRDLDGLAGFGLGIGGR